jgi:hypothetical protein
VTDDRDRGFAAELARCGALPTRIIETHVDDGTGHCTQCPAGSQAGRLTHPCNLRAVATEALVIQAQLQVREDPDGIGWLGRGEGPERPERDDR